MSDAMISQEPYPSRLKVTIDLLLKFLETFFELNPLAQIGLIICRDKHSERLQGFTSCFAIINTLNYEIINILSR
jgi:transcription initiation factor TFIIH subunit 2